MLLFLKSNLIGRLVDRVPSYEWVDDVQE